jgi:RNA polymerase sigma factor (sigma-70 family)
MTSCDRARVSPRLVLDGYDLDADASQTHVRLVLSKPVTTLQAAYLERRADLVRFFCLRLKSSEAAEDLVQDVFVKIADLDGRQIVNPAAYLYRLGWNVMLDTLRQQRRGAVRDGSWLNAQTSTLLGEPVSETPPADDAVASRQRLRRLLTLLEDLHPKTQHIFKLHKFEGLSHAEVAAKLGISRSSVEKHVSAAIHHLLEQLDGPI